MNLLIPDKLPVFPEMQLSVTAFLNLQFHTDHKERPESLSKYIQMEDVSSGASPYTCARVSREFLAQKEECSLNQTSIHFNNVSIYTGQRCGKVSFFNPRKTGQDALNQGNMKFGSHGSNIHADTSR